MTTRQILRTVIATGAGVIVAMLVIMAFEWLGQRIVPVPAQTDPMNPNLAKVPVGAMAAVVVAWFLGTLAGGAIANYLSKRHWPAWIVAALILCGALVQFARILHPVWMMVAGAAAPLLAAWIVSRMVPRQVPGSAPDRI